MKARVGILIAALVFCQGQAPPKRMALVIGNSAYTETDPLPNAKSDATAIAERVRRLGFEVVPDTIDLDKRRLADVIRDFGQQLRAAGPNVISFIYYAGHAAQDQAGVNYLIPVNADARTPQQLRQAATPIQPLLADMYEANNAVNILILDACRDWFKNDRSQGRPRGLHDMGRHASVLIAYATLPDHTADEGAADASSPYSKRLIEALDNQPEDPVTLLFDDVQSKVYSDTDSAQSPIFINGLARAGRWRLADVSVELRSGLTAKITDHPISAFLRGLDRSRLLVFARGRESFVDALLARRDILARHQIDTPDRLAFFIATIAHETAGFRAREENLAYPARFLLSAFPRHVTSEEMAARLARKPEQIANLIYANRMGNGDEASGDGWRYRGRGYFFMTGRANYTRYAQLVGADLVAQPELMSDPEVGLAVAAAFWSERRINVAADRNDLGAVTRAVAGGRIGLESRARWLDEARKALAPAPQARGPATGRVAG